MGVGADDIRIHNSTHLRPFYYPTNHVPFQGPISRGTLTTRSPLSSLHRGNRGSSEPVQRKGFLLPLLLNSKEVRRMETHSRPAGIELLPPEADVQNGDASFNYPIARQWGLVCSLRRARCLFPHHHTPSARVIPSVHKRERSFSILCPALRSGGLSKGFFENACSCGDTSP